MPLDFESSCGTKRVFRTWNAANFALKVARRFDKETKRYFHVYKCRYCQWWHIGHRYKD